MRTHFSDVVAEEHFRLKNKYNVEFEAKKHFKKQSKEYGSSVKKPKIDEGLRDKLLNEIRHPSTYLGR